MKPRIYLGDNQKVVGLYLGSNPIQIWAKGATTRKLLVKFNAITEAQKQSLTQPIIDKLEDPAVQAIITLYSNTSIISTLSTVSNPKWTNLTEEVPISEPITLATGTQASLTCQDTFTSIQIALSYPISEATLEFVDKITYYSDNIYITGLTDENVILQEITFDSVNIAFVNV